MKTTVTQFVTYGDEVRFFVNLSDKTAVPVWTSDKDYNKGWVDVHVGAYTAKARRTDAFAVRSNLLRTHYPSNTVERFFYDDLSYHSGLNQGTAGKVTNYGVADPNMVQFSRYTPVGRFKLLYPVKTSAPGRTGDTRNHVTAYDWEYIVNNWSPGREKESPLNWKVTHKIKYADGTEKILYESPVTSDPTQALSLFNSRVTGAGGKTYSVPDDLDRVFKREGDRLDKAREGKVKIRRTTGRRRVRRAPGDYPTSMRGIKKLVRRR